MSFVPRRKRRRRRMEDGRGENQLPILTHLRYLLFLLRSFFSSLVLYFVLWKYSLVCLLSISLAGGNVS